MAPGLEKLLAAAHYICHVAERDKLKKKFGATKLNKILWYADTINYLITGNSLTGEIYRKQQYGPVPQHILQVMGELEAQGCVKIGNSDFHGHTKRDFHCMQPPDETSLSQDEMRLLEQITRVVCEGHTAASISQLSHDITWEVADMGEEIPMCAAFVADIRRADRATIEWAEAALSCK